MAMTKDQEERFVKKWSAKFGEKFAKQEQLQTESFNRTLKILSNAETWGLDSLKRYEKRGKTGRVFPRSRDEYFREAATHLTAEQSPHEAAANLRVLYTKIVTSPSNNVELYPGCELLFAGDKAGPSGDSGFTKRAKAAAYLLDVHQALLAVHNINLSPEEKDRLNKVIDIAKANGLIAEGKKNAASDYTFKFDANGQVKIEPKTSPKTWYQKLKDYFEVLASGNTEAGRIGIAIGYTGGKILSWAIKWLGGSDTLSKEEAKTYLGMKALEAAAAQVITRDHLGNIHTTDVGARNVQGRLNDIKKRYTQKASNEATARLATILKKAATARQRVKEHQSKAQRQAEEAQHQATEQTRKAQRQAKEKATFDALRETAEAAKATARASQETADATKKMSEDQANYYRQKAEEAAKRAAEEATAGAGKDAEALDQKFAKGGKDTGFKRYTEDTFVKTRRFASQYGDAGNISHGTDSSRTHGGK
ncbi:MAG: hypothetical protein ACOY3I_08080 [Verrucomicrobiota bacterium]